MTVLAYLGYCIHCKKLSSFVMNSSVLEGACKQVKPVQRSLPASLIVQPNTVFLCAVFNLCGAIMMPFKMANSPRATPAIGML
jgi:hypothetical protein